MEKKFYNKKDAKIVQGIAICLMVWHHLFGFPDRIEYSYKLVLDTSFLSLETILAYFGRICIGMYAFVTGYGMYEKSKSIGNTDLKHLYREVFDSITRFYKRYWIVFFLFVPYGFFNRYNFSMKDLIKNIFGISSTYNAEWWYVREYVFLIISFPLVVTVIRFLWKQLENKKYLYYTAIILFIATVVSEVQLLQKLYVFLCFLMGILLNHEKIFEKVYEKIKYKSIVMLTMIAMGIIFISVISRIILTSTCLYDFIYVPIFIFGLVLLFKNQYIERLLGKVLELLGTYSMSIWLTHTFFVYYYFQKISFIPYYSILIFVWVMIINVVVAKVIDIICCWCKI